MKMQCLHKFNNKNILNCQIINEMAANFVHNLISVALFYKNKFNKIIKKKKVYVYKA